MPTGCIHDLISAQAASHPHRIALCHGSEGLTYADLEKLANKLGNYFRQCGVDRGVIVAVLSQRSIETVAALLGVLKIGGVCLPLDPSEPELRTSETIVASGARFLLTTTDFMHRCPASVQLINIDDKQAARGSAEYPSPPITLEDSAWLIYTSGSTGRPKGVEGVHGSLVARLSLGELPDYQTGDICAWTSPLAFGISAARLFVPLALGLQVTIVDDKAIKDIHQFIESIEQYQITSVFMVPTYLREFLRFVSLSPHKLHSLRVIATGGEPLSRDVIESFVTSLKHVKLVSLYGSSEIGTAAAQRIVTDDLEAPVRSVGQPLRNTRIYILDDGLRPVLGSDVGELYVGSKHLAKGYLNQPELSAERFKNDPFCGYDNGRMFQTGDMGRRLANGDIELVGRKDEQIKLRGFRIELGEIESVLRSHQGVMKAAVTVKGAEDRARLIGYIVKDVQIQLNSAQLKRFLQRRLPAPMIPARFVFLDSLPLTKTGKLDRMALPDPFAQPGQLQRDKGYS